MKNSCCEKSKKYFQSRKLVSCFVLILFAIFSCVVFSACGSDYRKLKINFYSTGGEVVEELNFVIDANQQSTTQRIGIELSGIDKKDVGQIKVYSLPNELIVDTNYVYSGNMCYVDIVPIMPSSGEAKLVATHLASGKSKQINLNIEQKSNSLQVFNSNYIISIPETETVEHFVDFSKLINLLPVGSTDKVFFKVLENPMSVEAIAVEDENLEEVFKGFKVNSSMADTTETTCVKICPVTYLEGYPQTNYTNQVISVYFKHTLNEDNFKIVPSQDISVDLNNIQLQLIANDLNLNNFKLVLHHEDTPLINTDFFDMYDIEIMSLDSQKISAFVDAKNDVVVSANVHTEDFVEIKIALKPIKYVGDIKRVEKSIFVKGDVKSDLIEVKKNGEIILTSEKTNIFDYYEEGNSLGALFNFRAVANSGASVHRDLENMQIVVSPYILCEENAFGEIPAEAGLNSKLYSLMFHLYNDPLEFYYDENSQMMVSQQISHDSRVYIKYVDGGGTEESANFGIKVQTVNNSSLENWEDIKPTTANINFNRLEGVKSMSLEAGYYEVVGNVGNYDAIGKSPNYIYLNRLEGLDNDDTTVKYLSVENNSVLSIDGMSIAKVDFEVEIKPLFDAAKPLELFFGVAAKDSVAIQKGNDRIIYQYNSQIVEDIISLVFRKDTSIGDYQITFYQEGIAKASTICRVYEDIKAISVNNIDFETSKIAFENRLYKDTYDADYIVASGQELKIEVNLPQDVLNSQIVKEYGFEFAIGPTQAQAISVDGYFEKTHDDKTFNNAMLKFVKGTYYDDVANYVYLTITVKTKKFDNIVTESTEVNEIAYTLSFFIYEEIKNEDIGINHSNITRYFKRYLSVYNTEYSQAELEIQMDSSLWNYVTLSPNNNLVDWKLSDTTGVLFNENGTKCDLEFDYSNNETSNYVRVVKAYIYQFDKVFEMQCVFNVEKPILTERLTITSDIQIRDSQDLSYYINLKEGESYQVVANNYSSKGVVTLAETIIQVADETGSAYTARDYFDVDQTNGIITVKKVDAVHKFKLIVFAKDVLKYIPSSDKSGYNSPSTFLMDFTGVEQGLYNKAYFVVDIELSNGTKENPYLINSANDFWEIDDTEEFRKANYKLMTSLSLNNTTDKNSKTIKSFAGTIVTDSDNIYTLDGITLNNENKNLFDELLSTTEISNIKFVVNYDYDFTSSKYAEEFLGLVSNNNGLLTDVSVVVCGLAKFNVNAIRLYFGGLVGDNYGTITYTKTFGVIGEISLSGNSQTYFGGLAGRNMGKILGCEQPQANNNNNVVLNVSSGREKALSQIVVNSQLTHASSSIGGVVGLNTFIVDKIGVVHDAFVQAKIYAESTSNVGGVIGTNEQTINSLTLSRVSTSSEWISAVEDVLESQVVDDKLVRKFIDNAIYNVKTASTIKAYNNVGGVVGLDLNGVYIECDYQILSEENKQPAIRANNNVGGIAGKSTNGKFAYCSVMSYCWNYAGLKDAKDTVITDVEDIIGYDYVGGIVGYAVSSTNPLRWEDNGGNQVVSIEIKDRVIVNYSSVNAYLRSLKVADGGNVGNIGGILSSGSTNNNSYMAIVFNAYFIGRLEGNVCYETKTTQAGGNVTTHYLALDNNSSSIYNVVYTLNLEEVDDAITLRLGNIKDGLFFIINANPNISHWWHNANINGGYAFITPDTQGANRLPIFDLAPENIKVTAKNPKAPGLEKALVLEYYDFSQNELLTDVQLAEINEKENRNQKLLDLLNFEVSPTGLGTVVLNVKSTNINVIDITYDGRLLINGVGECELIFNSVLNPNAGDVKDRTIKVVVDYPIGNSFNISTSKTDKGKIIENSLNIAKGISKHFYVLTEGYVDNKYDFFNDIIDERYYYKTKNNMNLKVDVSYSSALTISDYIRISGMQGTQENNTLTVKVDEKTPFTMSVIRMLESGSFNVKVTPYIVVDGIEIGYKNVAKETIDFNFVLLTRAGATNVSFSYDDAIVYPNDTLYLTALINTDVAICGNLDGSINIEYLQTMVDELLARPQYLNNIMLNIKCSNNVNYLVEVDSSVFIAEQQIQTIMFRIEFTEMDLSEEELLILEMQTEYGNLAQVNFTIIPQRINKIEIKNYYNKNMGTINAPDYQWVLDDVLKPNYPGMIYLDMVPNNGYYSYLEISDITGDEEILFIQVDENGNAITLGSDPSSDNKGIKLYGQADRSRILVRTQIDKNYSSKIHTVEVRAYSNNGTLLHRQTTEIDVKMLPKILVDYILPSGNNGSSLNSLDETEKTGLYIANGVNANFRVRTEDANGDLEYAVIGLKEEGGKYVQDNELTAKYSFEKDLGDYYVLRRNDTPIEETDNGKKIRITFTTYAYMDNGDFEKAECAIEFTIIEFVVHGVSVNNSIDNADKQEIYGYLDKDVKLNFYFDKDDISFYDPEAENEPYWDTVYTYTAGIEEDYTTTSSKYQVYSILKALNSYDINGVNNYLILNNKERNQDGTYKTDGLDVSKISLKNNKLYVKEGYDNDQDKWLANAFKLYYHNNVIDPSNNGWKTTTLDVEIKDTHTYVVDKNYKLNFQRATAWYEPTVVHNEQDFLEMTSGGRYILAKDLVLTNYVPLDVNLLEFDGNGRTITINSFGLFNDEAIQAGLFRQVYDNMIVKNVVVNYESIKVKDDYTLGNVSVNGITYTDLCNNSSSANYSSLNFGGLAAINNGIITNCYVKGTIAISASTIEQKKFSNEGSYQINFYVGGMVAENGSTGYITNSTSELSIFAQANIGGFAYSNGGKIASCGVEELTTIYGYNTSLEKTIVVEIAGFVVRNSSNISMSYVNLKKQSKITSSVYQGTMSAKDISAGFAYANSGDIVDSYVQITETGINNNTFAGFVSENSGLIKRAYTFVNLGLKVNNNDSMFAPAGSIGFENCIEFISNRTNYSNGIEVGVDYVDVTYRYNIDKYQEYGFAFGDNESAVWTIDSGSMPRLVSAQDKIMYTGSADYDGLMPLYQVKDQQDDGVDEITYKPNFAYYGTKENPYIIHDLETWNLYFSDNSTAYYRIVKDIDFVSHGDNPITSTMTFKGNIQGNNMILKNIMLYSTSSLDALGLFRKMESADDYTIKNSVRNLTITSTSVWASKTSAVGLLAGMIEDFNVYNITIDAENVIMVGGNAVGGIAGVVRGSFDMDQISSNIGANSTRASTLYNYSINISVNNRKTASANLNNVYYAGSVVGILDGYDRANFDINAERDLSKKYFMVQNVSVNGNITIIGDTVGGAFGFVGERVHVRSANINISGSLAGAQYSAGLAGENRGVIDVDNKQVVIADNVFEQSTNVSAGLVGFNLGGLIRNAQVKVNISKKGYGKIVAGIVGRNIYGTLNNVRFDGELNASFTGGIMGVNYSHTMLINASTGAGTLTSECKLNNTYLIPQQQIAYKENDVELKKLENVSLGRETFEYMVNVSKEFYTYKSSKEANPTLDAITSKSKVLGLVVGLSYEEGIVNKIDAIEYDKKYLNRYAISLTDNEIIFNVPYKSQSGNVLPEDKLEQLFGEIEFKSREAGDEDNGVILKDEVDDTLDIKHIFEDVNIMQITPNGKVYVMYLVGSKVSAFDSWYNSYSADYILVYMDTNAN